MRIDAPWLHWPETRTLAKALPLRFVGGAVRDALLGRDVRDVDAATPLEPQAVMERLKAAGIKAIPTGIDHGTITALSGERHFEITTLRRDVETDGRHAVVAYTQDWKEDASRRDFTMNALFCDAEGELFDYFGGAEDARAGYIRFIGNADDRIREDGLRILRFFRFFAYYGKGAPDAQALKAAGAHASMIDSLSGERIQQEMLKLLSAGRAPEVIEIMAQMKIWQHVVPAAVQTTSLDRLRALLTHAPDPLLALALLLRTASDANGLADTVSRRWKFSKAQSRRLEELCASPPWSVGEKEWKKHLRVNGAALFTDRALIALSEGADHITVETAMELAQTWQPPVFPVTGNDLLARNIKPGRELGETLRALEAQWEESDYTLDREALLKG